MNKLTSLAIIVLAPSFAFGQDSLTDSLKTKQIDEVVVVGYKTQRKETLTTSVASVAGDQLKDVATPNFQNALQGKMPGVTVAISSGQPGSKPTIRIRGISSLGASNDPLYVVDGVIVHGTGDVPPDQIETISVLKDAAATALYGSRGAAGVILVTTKSGKGGGGIGVNVTNTYNFFNMGKFKVMNSQQQKERFTEFANNGANLESILEAVSGGAISRLDQINENFDWYDAATQVGEVLDANISFSKSKEGSRFYMMGGYYKETGTVKGYEYNRFNARINQETQINNWLKVSPKLFFKYDMVDDKEFSLFDGAMKMPWDNPFYEDGRPKNVLDDESLVWFSRDRENYLYDRDKYYGKDNTLEGQGNIDFEIKLAKNLKFLSINGLTYYNNDNFSYSDPSAIGTRSDDMKGTTNAGSAIRWTKYTNQMLKYENVWNDQHRLNALVAYEYMDYMYKGFSASAKKIIPNTEVLGGAEPNGAPGGVQNEYAFKSVLSNFDYSFDDRYLLQASLRTDQSSRFTPKYNRGWFWGVSAGWNVHNENFYKNIATTVNKLKIRGSYGSQGNVPSEAFGNRALYGTYDLANPSNYLVEVALIPSQLANKTLKWETLLQSNVGIDASLFNNRVNLTFDWYNKDTKDLITFMPLSYTTGFADKLANIGQLNNRGIEIALDADVIKSQNFTWNVSANFSKNITKFIDLYQDNQITGNYIRKEGAKYLTYRLKEWAGVDVATGNPMWYKVNSDGSKEKVTNWNTATYQVLDKTRLPDFIGSLTTSVSYKGLTLSANAYFNIGGYIYNSERSLMDSDGIYPFYNQMAMADGWIRWKKGDPDGTNNIATHPSLVYNDGRRSNQPSTRYLEEGTFVKIRNISLSYALPKTLVPANTIKNARIFVNMDNFFRFTKFSGMDPEAGMTEDTYYKYPVPKSISMGMNFSF